MLRSRIVRFATAGVFVATPLALALGFSGPASASQPATASIKCTGLSGNITSTVTLSGCNGNTGGGSQPLLATSLASGGTITWLNGKTTTIATPKLSTGTACPASSTSTDERAKAKITADTTGSVTVGSKAKIEVCISGTGAISLPPGKDAKI